MSILQLLKESSPRFCTVGLAFIRSGIGILFIGHGYQKITGGVEEWQWMGEQMAAFGITFAPAFWGLCAALSQLFGGICLAIGFGTRIAAFFMSLVMFVAIIYHIKNGDGYGYISFPLSQLVIFIALIITGGGPYSLDHYASGFIKKIFSFKKR